MTITFEFMTKTTPDFTLWCVARLCVGVIYLRVVWILYLSAEHRYWGCCLCRNLNIRLHFEPARDTTNGIASVDVCPWPIWHLHVYSGRYCLLKIFGQVMHILNRVEESHIFDFDETIWAIHWKVTIQCPYCLKQYFFCLTNFHNIFPNCWTPLHLHF